MAIEKAVSAGLSNVSLDLIFGTPGQTVAQLEQDLRVAVTLPVSHVSTYALSIEPGTPFFQRQERGLLGLPPDDTVVAMLARIPEVLAEHGLVRYEISNYAKPGFESRHNMVYWRGGDYLGVGAGAHSYLAQRSLCGSITGASRWSTLALPEAFVKATSTSVRIDEAASVPSPLVEPTVSWRETLDMPGSIFEFFYLGMRLVRGVSEGDFFRRFGESMPQAYVEHLNELVREGYVNYDAGCYALTTKGIAVADSVFERLLVGSHGQGGS
jgi:oxygen-independent coproporphyrinogen-3 oxidase